MVAPFRAGVRRGLTQARLNSLRSRHNPRLGRVTTQSSPGSHIQFCLSSSAAAAAPVSRLPDVPETVPIPETPHRVSIAEIKERRAKAGRLVAPTAAPSDADMFKGPVCSYVYFNVSNAVNTHLMSHRPLGNQTQSAGTVSTYTSSPILPSN